jgi:hypothetical protein
MQEEIDEPQVVKSKKIHYWKFSILLIIPILAIVLGFVLNKNSQPILDTTINEQDNISFKEEIIEDEEVLLENQFENFDSKTVETQLDLSETYDIAWVNQELLLYKNTLEIDRFSLKEKPLHITIHKPSNTLAIVTTPSGNINDVHNLYIRDDGQTNLAYKGKIRQELSDLIIKDSLYTYWYDDVSYIEYISHPSHGLIFSPDGKSFFTVARYWESGEILQTVIDQKTTTILDRIKTWNGLSFSRDSECALHSNEVGRASDSMLVGRNSDSGFIFNNIDISKQSNEPIFSNREKNSVTVYWKNNCQPIIKYTASDKEESYYEVVDNVLESIDNIDPQAKLSSLDDFQEVILLTLLKEE